MRGTSSEKTLQANEAYGHLSATHGYRVCTYRPDNGRFSEPLFKEEFHTYGQHISYCGVGYHHQNAIDEHRVK